MAIQGASKISCRAAYEKFGRGDLSHAEARRRGVDVPFDLPQGWAWARLGEIAEVQLGKMLDKKNITGVLYPYLANVSVRWGAFDLDNLKKMPFLEAEVVKFALKTGDIIMCEGGVPGRCAVWREDTACVKYQKALHRIRVYEILPEFVRYYFEAIHETMFFTSRFSGSTIHHLPRETLIQIQIPIPPVDEQKRIVAKIEELFSLADLLGTAADGLENAAKRLDKKILDLAIRGRLVPQDPNDEPASELVKRIAASHKSPCKNQGKPIDPPFESPGSWEWVRLKELGVFCGGHTPSTSNPKLWGGDILWVSSKDMKSKYIDDTQLKVTRLGAEELNVLKPGALLMCTRSGILRRVFPVAIARRELTINQDQRALTLWLPEMIEYVYLALKSLESIILSDYKKSGTTVESIIWNKFVDLPIPLPPLNEQKRIVKRVEELKATTRTLVTF